MKGGKRSKSAKSALASCGAGESAQPEQTRRSAGTAGGIVVMVPGEEADRAAAGKAGKLGARGSTMRLSRGQDGFVETDGLLLLPRGPTSLYVYWEMSDIRRRMAEAHFQCGWEALPKILRLYDVTGIIFEGAGSNGFRDIVLDNRADNWFIHDVNDKCDYCADFGTTAIDGRFITLLRSNTVRTPPKDEQQPGASTTAVVKILPAASEPQWFSQFSGYSLASAR